MLGKEKERLLREHDELETLKTSLENTIVKLRVKQQATRQILEQMTTWKSGQSQAEFFRKYNEYFQMFTKKIDDLELLKAEVHHQQKKVRDLYQSLELPLGPKW